MNLLRVDPCNPDRFWSFKHVLKFVSKKSAFPVFIVDDNFIGNRKRAKELLQALVRQLASATPRNGEWERSYRALQEQARRTLAVFRTAALNRQKGG